MTNAIRFERKIINGRRSVVAFNMPVVLLAAYVDGEIHDVVECGFRGGCFAFELAESLLAEYGADRVRLEWEGDTTDAAWNAGGWACTIRAPRWVTRPTA